MTYDVHVKRIEKSSIEITAEGRVEHMIEASANCLLEHWTKDSCKTLEIEGVSQ